MKTKIFAVLLGGFVVALGCVDTVTGRKTGGLPLIQDKMEGRYERPLDRVFQAAKEVVQFNGTLVNESILHDQTNAVRTVEGKVNQRSVWVRVEAMNPNISSVTVQTRTQAGGSDLSLAHEIEKQIALKLAAP